ncbi:MAG: hypothetical protein V8S39_10945 [Lachnospiraceae bacterium]|jgi:hypothetical protein
MTKENHYSKNNSRLKQFFCIISSFLLAVSLTVLALFICVKAGFANISQITRAFGDSNYYNSVYNTMMDECENEAIISGLSKDIFTGVFSLDELTSYCNTYASSMMNNQSYTLDTSAMEQKLSENIQAYVSENNLAVDGDMNEVIRNFTSTIMAYYKTAVQLPYFDQIASMFRLFDKLLMYILPCMIVFSIVLIILLFRLNTFKKNRIFRYLAYSALSSAISVLILPAFCYITKFYRKLAISPEYVYKYIISYIENGIFIFLIAGIILFVFGIVFIITSSMIKAKLKKEYVPVHHHHHEMEV